MDTMIGEAQVKTALKSQRWAYQLLHLSAWKVLEDEDLLTLILTANPYMLGNADPGVIFDKIQSCVKKRLNIEFRWRRETSTAGPLLLPKATLVSGQRLYDPVTRS